MSNSALKAFVDPELIGVVSSVHFFEVRSK